MIGRKPQFRPLQGGLDQPHPLIHAGLGELDDQDGVLGGQTQGGQQPDLEIDVVGQSPRARGDDAADHPQGQDQQDRDRDGPALIERRQAQEDHEDGEGVQQRRLGARPSAPGRRAPVQSKPTPCGSFRTNSSMACMASPELRPGAASPRMLMDGKPLKRSSFGEPDVQWPEAKEEKGTILPGGVAHVELLQVLGQHAVGGVGLDIDPLDPAALDEVVDIGAAEGRRDRVVDRT